MSSLSFRSFKQQFAAIDPFRVERKGSTPTNVAALEARRLIGEALRREGSVANRQRTLEAAAKKAGIPSEEISLSIAETLTRSRAAGRPDHVWALYYYFHWRGLHADILDKVDQRLLGKRFEDVAGQPVRVRAPVPSSGTKSAWSISDDKLRLFFDPILSDDKVGTLIDITHTVVNENLARQPIDYKSSIVECAIDEGILENELGTQWLTAALCAGLSPDFDSGSIEDEHDEFIERYRDNWRFLGSTPTELEKTWLQKIAENSEDREFLARERETTDLGSAESRKRRLLLDCLLATQESSPVVRGLQSVIGHLTQFSDMNLSAQTRDFLDYSRARNAAVTGQSELAIQTYYKLKDKPFRSERMVDIRYHLINASYALRMTSLYGTKEVSTRIKLSPDNDDEIQHKLNTEFLGGFDAHDEIAKFCQDFDINPNDFNDDTIEDYVRRFNGPNGAKIVYFHHLEAILRAGRQHRVEIEERYDEIVRMLKILSNTSRSGDYAAKFTKDAWYPLVFLHSVAANLDHFELMTRIENDLGNFDGWPQGRALIADVQDEQKSGSFQMLLYRLNRGLAELKQKRKMDLAAQLRDLHRNFRQIRFMPALSQNVMLGVRSLGDDYDRRQDVTALARRGVSHWNYMIGGGNIKFDNFL